LQGSFLWKELPDRAEDRPLRSKGAAPGGISRKSHVRFLWNPAFLAKGLLSFVACDDTNGRVLRYLFNVHAMLTY